MTYVGREGIGLPGAGLLGTLGATRWGIITWSVGLLGRGGGAPLLGRAGLGGRLCRVNVSEQQNLN